MRVMSRSLYHELTLKPPLCRVKAKKEMARLAVTTLSIHDGMFVFGTDRVKKADEHPISDGDKYKQERLPHSNGPSDTRLDIVSDQVSIDARCGVFSYLSRPQKKHREQRYQPC